MGYEARDLVVASVGSIKPYKGLSRLAIELAAAMEEEPRLAAVVAGAMRDDDPALLDAVGAVPRIEFLPKRMNPGRLATIVRAADIVALPYQGASLNSGAAMLAMTFGRPILAPRIAAFTPVLAEGLGIGYDPEDPGGLRAALSQIPDFVAGFEEGAAFAYASRYDPAVVSDAFFDAALAGLGGG